MKITWHGHACFSLECPEGTIVFDPFADKSVPGIKDLDLTADLVLCSHEHYDHNARDKVSLRHTDCFFKIDTIPSFHDDKNGLERGNNIIHIVETEGKKIAHLGDLGHFISGDKRLYNCDILFIPVGGHYTIDAKTAKDIIDELKPRTVIPMHYRHDNFGFDVISHLNDFTALCENYQELHSNTWEVPQEIPQQILIFEY